MKKLLGVVVLSAGIAAGVALLPEDGGTLTTDVRTAEIIKALTIGKFRLAVADRPCPEEGQASYTYLVNNCVKWKTVRDYCGCLTSSEDPLNGEMDPAEIPDAAFRRVGVCEREQDGKVIQSLEFAPIGSAVPPGWTCKLIHNRILNWRISHRASETQLVQALKDKCCSLCDPGGCWITNDSWGACPYCLLDSTPACSTHCQTE